MTRWTLVAGLGLCVGLYGCASTKVETSGAAAKQPLCQTTGEHLSALLLKGGDPPFAGRALVEGGTEVVLELKVLDVHTGEPMANLHTHWQNGGAFVIKGVKTLEQDMSAALQAALAPAAPSR